MKIADFCDMEKLEDLVNNWSKATGMVVTVLDEAGTHLTENYQNTDFCNYTQGTHKGREICDRCQREGKGAYTCDLGLYEFKVPITLSDGKVLADITAGTVQPKPISIGTIDLPDKPIFLSNLSIIKATRAI